MNPRALVLGTLLPLLSFCALVKMAASQENSSTILPGPAARADVETLRRKAEGGDARAQSLLGTDYMTGKGVTEDFKEAAKWYLAAAAQGSADAQFSLGYLYEQGKGASRDYRQAVANYTAAARQGHPIAENNLGSMYEHGRGVAMNL